MTHSHTPGPWRAWYDKHSRKTFVLNTDDVELAALDDVPDQEANGNLMADAPRLAELNAELVAALENMVSVYQDDPRDCSPDQQPQCIQQARTVLAKAAKGRE